eukprot:TRINITY_DN1538_c1_g3_i1.p1 TRINITY_DN1538_c1_g3~~TRINITY_DN1538_c1_g3_i1.p1  ORF type:complete len:1005 (-),score=292.52 TRINITY_DN1538_c1_g3_i1:35-3049(-)
MSRIKYGPDLSQLHLTPENSVGYCFECEKEFSRSEKKRHCWICGDVFCENCTPKTKKIEGFPAPKHICLACGLLGSAACVSDKEGILKKYIRFRWIYTLRHFILQGNTIKFFTPKGRIDGAFDLRHCESMVECGNTIFELKGKGRSLKMKAPSSDIKNEWMKTLQKALDNPKKTRMEVYREEQLQKRKIALTGMDLPGGFHIFSSVMETVPPAIKIAGPLLRGATLFCRCIHGIDRDGCFTWYKVHDKFVKNTHLKDAKAILSILKHHGTRLQSQGAVSSTSMSRSDDSIVLSRDELDHHIFVVLSPKVRVISACNKCGAQTKRDNPLTNAFCSHCGESLNILKESTHTVMSSHRHDDLVGEFDGLDCPHCVHVVARSHGFVKDYVNKQSSNKVKIKLLPHTHTKYCDRKDAVCSFEAGHAGSEETSSKNFREGEILEMQTSLTPSAYDVIWLRLGGDMDRAAAMLIDSPWSVGGWLEGANFKIKDESKSAKEQLPKPTLLPKTATTDGKVDDKKIAAKVDNKDSVENEKEKTNSKTNTDGNKILNMAKKPSMGKMSRQNSWRGEEQPSKVEKSPKSKNEKEESVVVKKETKDTVKEGSKKKEEETKDTVKEGSKKKEEETKDTVKEGSKKKEEETKDTGKEGSEKKEGIQSKTSEKKEDVNSEATPKKRPNSLRLEDNVLPSIEELTRPLTPGESEKVPIRNTSRHDKFVRNRALSAVLRRGMKSGQRPSLIEKEDDKKDTKDNAKESSNMTIKVEESEQVSPVKTPAETTIRGRKGLAALQRRKSIHVLVPTPLGRSRNSGGDLNSAQIEEIIAQKNVKRPSVSPSRTTSSISPAHHSPSPLKSEIIDITIDIGSDAEAIKEESCDEEEDNVSIDGVRPGIRKNRSFSTASMPEEVVNHPELQSQALKDMSSASKLAPVQYLNILEVNKDSFHGSKHLIQESFADCDALTENFWVTPINPQVRNTKHNNFFLIFLFFCKYGFSISLHMIRTSFLHSTARSKN